MKKDANEISKLHMFLRTNSLFAPAREFYSFLIMFKEKGFSYACRTKGADLKKRLYRYRRYGIRGIISILYLHTRRKRYHKKIFLTHKEWITQRNQVYPESITFSILVPLYNTPENFLREMIASVQNQTYPFFQLCLADGSDEEHAYVQEVIKEYADTDDRIHYKKLEENGGISDNTNACLEMAQGEYIVLFDHDDLLHEAALFELRKAIDDKQADFIYTDEAIFSADYRKPDDYHFKPDFAIDNLRANNYICHLTCFSKTLSDRVGGFRRKYDGSQDFDMILRLTEKAKTIVHIPKILYFWRVHEMSTASDISAKSYCINAGKSAVEAHLKRAGIEGEVASSQAFPLLYRIRYTLSTEPLVTILVWIGTTKNNWKECLESIKRYTSYGKYEILTCRSSEERDSLAKRADGEYLLFMEDTCICCNREWFQELLSVAQRDDVGAVSPRILYKNDTIRDAGITLGIGSKRLAANSFYRIQSDHLGFMGNMYYMHNVSAVSDSCMMLRKCNYIKAGGFDCSLPAWYAGIDLSLKLREMGKINVVNPYATVRYKHLEINRDITGNYYGMRKYNKQLKERWGHILQKPDPYYNCNLTKYTSDFRVG